MEPLLGSLGFRPDFPKSRQTDRKGRKETAGADMRLPLSHFLLSVEAKEGGRALHRG